MTNTSVAQRLRLTAVSMRDHGSLVRSEHVKRAARRLDAGADQAYLEEGQALIRSAAADLRLAGFDKRYESLALRLQRAADYLELENDRLAGDFATQAADELFVLRRSYEIEN